MNRIFLIVPISIFLTLATILSEGFAQVAMEATVEAIVANKDSYHEKEVSVTGTVSTPKFKASRRRKPYMTFPILGDSGGRINILLWGDMKLKPGRKVSVRGTFRKIMPMGKYTFRDIVEANKISKIDTK